jgi:hypothetical protein
MHSEVSNLDIELGLSLFNKYGSNVRVIVDILNKRLNEATYCNDVEMAAAQIAREFSTTLQEVQILDFDSKFPQRYLCSNPMIWSRDSLL